MMKTKPTYKIEQQLFRKGCEQVIGVDEAGRGCLAGPVVAAAVALNLNLINKRIGRAFWWRDIQDSKLLSPEKRFMLEPVIKQHSLSWGIGVIAPADIDELNIHHASLLAMKRAVEDLGTHGTRRHVLIDGRFNIPELPDQILQTAIVSGDMSVLSISAASILAKTFRDRLMVKLHAKFPEYDFARHKGYGTKVHRDAIIKHGLSPVHRLSFCGEVA